MEVKGSGGREWIGGDNGHERQFGGREGKEWIGGGCDEREGRLRGGKDEGGEVEEVKDRVEELAIVREIERRG